jgi:hypothetical protein
VYHTTGRAEGLCPPLFVASQWEVDGLEGIKMGLGICQIDTSRPSSFVHCDISHFFSKPFISYFGVHLFLNCIHCLEVRLRSPCSVPTPTFVHRYRYVVLVACLISTHNGPVICY